MERLGHIVRLQVQVRSLKVGEAPRVRYDPGAIVTAAALVLDSGGVRGMATDGSPLDDVHHRDHSASKSRGDNGISICTTGNYTAMRGRFGEIITDGIAGENILVASDRVLSPHEAARGILIETANGPVELSNVIVAAPCAPFTRFAMHLPDEARPDLTVTEHLRFLDNGMRGFYATFLGAEARISPGDAVFLR